MIATERFVGTGGLEIQSASARSFRKGHVMDEPDQTAPTPSVTVRSIVESLAEGFCSSEAAKHRITDRAMNVILENPELDLTEPHRELLPIVRAVATGDARRNADEGTASGS